MKTSNPSLNKPPVETHCFLSREPRREENSSKYWTEDREKEVSTILDSKRVGGAASNQSPAPPRPGFSRLRGPSHPRGAPGTRRNTRPRGR